MTMRPTPAPALPKARASPAVSSAPRPSIAKKFSQVTPLVHASMVASASPMPPSMASSRPANFWRPSRREFANFHARSPTATVFTSPKIPLSRSSLRAASKSKSGAETSVFAAAPSLPGRTFSSSKPARDFFASSAEPPSASSASVSWYRPEAAFFVSAMLLPKSQEKSCAAADTKRVSSCTNSVKAGITTSTKGWPKVSSAPRSFATAWLAS